ncbi:MAG: cation:proton antiporter [Chloroflexota bacterium]
MTPFLQFALALAILIAAAKIGGFFSYRLGQPSVLGELLAGILLGPSLVNLLHLHIFTDQHLAQVIHELAEIGVLLLMFLAGIELQLTDLAKTGRVAALAGTLGVFFPLLLGMGAGLLFGMERVQAVFLGLVLAATSVSISAQTLMELGTLRSRVGISLLGAAVFDDVLVVLALSIFTALTGPDAERGWGPVLVTVARMLLFLGLGGAIGLLVLPRTSRRVSRLPVSQGLVAFTMVTILIYGWAAEMFGSMAAITGAFLVGLIFARSPVKERVESGIVALAYGLFVPIFFINVGLTADLRQLVGGGNLALFIVMSLVAVVGKVLGAGLGGRLGGLAWNEALQLGIGMISRGEVGLIVATVGVSQQMITPAVFSAVVGVIILTTLVTPPLLRVAFRPRPAAARPAPASETQPDSQVIKEGEDELPGGNHH